MIKKNAMKAKLLSGQAVVGFLIPGNWPEAVEVVGLLGADYVWIDGEHAVLGLPEIANLVRAAECAGVTPIARVPRNAPDVISRYLDLGVQGILVPSVDTREEAERVVRATKYYPEGKRGIGYGHAINYFVGLSFADYIEMANRETMVIIQCESKEGLENLEEIVRVPGVDLITIGPADLSLSLGIPGQLDSLQVPGYASLEQGPIAQAKEIVLRAGKKFGMGALDGDHARELIAANVSMIIMSINDIIKAGAREYLAKARAGHK